MSMIRCSRCDKYLDSDFHDIVEDPKTGWELMCLIHAEEDAEDGITQAQSITQSQYADTVNPLIRADNG